MAAAGDPRGGPAPVELGQGFSGVSVALNVASSFLEFRGRENAEDFSRLR